MRAKWSSRNVKHPMVLLAVVTVLAVFAGSCRNNEVEVPPLTGPSGARLFLTIQANPDHLVIHAPGRPRETSDISIQLKNQQGQGVPGENLKLRILNVNFFEINIGRLSDYNVRTDTAGFARVIYTAPDTSELLGATSIIISAVLTNAAYPDEVTDHHEIELQAPAIDPGDCAGALAPQDSIDVNPTAPVINQTVCFTGSDVFPTAIEFFWDFGDGSPDATGPVVCHAYESAGSFQITLFTRSLDRDCGNLQQIVTIGPGVAPTCTVIISPGTIVKDQTVNFTATTMDPDGRVKRFLWNFGDGETQTTSRNTTTHKYETNGTFNGVLTVTDDQGNVGTCTFSVTVGEEVVGAPTCSFTVSPTITLAGTTVVSVNASSSTDSDGEIVEFTVDWGDGSFDILSCPAGDCPTGSGLPIITKTSSAGVYATAGDFIVTLVVEDDDDPPNSAVCTQQITVCPALGCAAATQCSDGSDNDGDGLIDLLDPNCTGTSDDNEAS